MLEEEINTDMSLDQNSDNEEPEIKETDSYELYKAQIQEKAADKHVGRIKTIGPYLAEKGMDIMQDEAFAGLKARFSADALRKIG